jgi:hypothetical protein
MKKFVLHCLATLLPALAMSFPNEKKVLLDAPVLKEASKGTYPNYIRVVYMHNLQKYPNAVKYEVQRRKWLDNQGLSKAAWTSISKINHTDTELLDFGSAKEPLILGTHYDYRVRFIWKAKDSSGWSNIDYGYIDRSGKRVSAPVLYRKASDTILWWSPVAGAQAYRLQIIAGGKGKRYNHDLNRGFYNAAILKDTILTQNEYVWRGNDSIYWSVRVLNPQDSGCYAYPLRSFHTESEAVYGSGTRLGFFKWQWLMNPQTLNLIVQNTTKKDLADFNIGIYGANEPIFDTKKALLLGSTHLYLSADKNITINHNLKNIDFQYIMIVPFQDGRAMMDEIEVIQRF